MTANMQAVRLGLGFGLAGWITLLAGCACSRRCPPGMEYVRGQCVGDASKSARYVQRYAPAKPADMPKRAPLGAPELKALPAVAPVVLQGATPRWFESADEVRAQAGLPEAEPLKVASAWQMGPVYSFATTPELGPVSTQLDYFFLGDNLVGYGIRFFVEDGASQELWDELITQARKSYGPPQKQADGNLDWLMPKLAVHAALTSSSAMSELRKHPVRLANVHWTIPPALR